jgi:hypothetical protein
MNRPQAQQRVRITGPRRDVRRAPRRNVAAEIDAQTGMGEAYVRTLIRSQLRLGVATIAAVVMPLAAMPLLFGLWPTIRNLSVGPVPLWWVLLGVGVYPATLLVSWWYVRRAERNEARFSALVDRR